MIPQQRNPMGGLVLLTTLANARAYLWTRLPALVIQHREADEGVRGSGDPSHNAWRLILIVLFAGSGWGQQIVHETWTFREGAPQVVESLAQTTDGYLWLGTESGLYRFDGARFERFQSPFGDQLPATDVACLFAPRTGGLWIGYRIGGSFSFLRNGKLADFKFPSPTGTVQGFAQDRHGIVWAGSTRGVWRFDGSKWQQNPYEWDPHTSVAQVGFDRKGILWVLTDRRSTEVGRQLFYLLPDGTKFRKAGSNLFVEGLTWDADAAVLTTRENPRGTPGSGVELEDSLPAYPILRKNSEQTLDRADGIWFVSSYDPLFRHPTGTPLAEVISKASPGNSRVYKFDPYRYSRIVDREGSIWIGDMRGVHRFSYSPLTQPQLPTSHGWFTAAPDERGKVWISNGTGTGQSTLYRLADGKMEFQREQRGLANFAYRAPDKTFWFGGEGGLWHMVGDRFTRVELPPALANPDNGQFLQAITQDRSGGMWVSFWNRGVYRFADGVWTEHGGRSDLPKQRVYCEFRDQLDRIWFGSRNNVLAVLDGDRVQTFGPTDGIRVGEITAIYGRGPDVWIGGEFGLQQFDHGRIHSINAVHKESLSGISGIVETANGDLWLNGAGGIFHVRRAEITEALKNLAYRVSGERFGRGEGLVGLAAPLRPLPSAIEGTNGRLWFTVNNGVFSLDPARASKQVVVFPVTIQSVSADDKGYSLESPIRLPPRTSSVQIGYAAVSLSDPGAIRFRYKLRETDKDWHDAGASNFVSYRNLAPGAYHFVVNASDTNSLWSVDTATVEFTMLPAYYQTNWFRSLFAAVIVAVLWAVYQNRIQQLQREFNARIEERTRIARELHDTLLQSFQASLIRMQAARNMFVRRSENAMQNLDAAINIAAAAVEEGRDAIQDLRAQPPNKGDLAELLTTAGQELAHSEEAPGNPPVFGVTVEGERRDLAPLIQDEVYRIARELLRNAFRHAQASRIQAEIRYESRQLRVHVRDDGKGIDPEILKAGGRAGHWGMPGMRERADRLGGKLDFWSEAGAGTEAVLTVPAAAAYGASNGGPFSFLRRKKARS